MPDFCIADTRGDSRKGENIARFGRSGLKKRFQLGKEDLRGLGVIQLIAAVWPRFWRRSR